MLQKKFTKKGLTVLAAVAALISTNASANLLVNSGFEDPLLVDPEVDTGATPGWTGFSNFGGPFIVNGLGFPSALPNSGLNSLKAFGTAGVFQTFATNPGEAWDGNVFVLNNSNDAMDGGMTAAINIEWKKADGSASDITPFISNGTFNCNLGDCTNAPQDVWTQIFISGVAPDDAAFAQLTLITGDFQEGSWGGAPQFDDAFFDRAPAVPVPAAVWLFGSGLLGLVGVARRRKAQG